MPCCMGLVQFILEIQMCSLVTQSWDLARLLLDQVTPKEGNELEVGKWCSFCMSEWEIA